MFEALELVFQIIFTVEMVLKILAHGFYKEKFAYLRDGWNIMDFVIVLSGWATFKLESNVMVLRTVRILRTLRAM
jgi:hypothetical protein